MKIKCKRPILSSKGIAEITFYFDTETLELDFDERDYPLLIEIFNKQAVDCPELTDYEAEAN